MNVVVVEEVLENEQAPPEGNQSHPDVDIEDADAEGIEYQSNPVAVGDEDTF